MATNEKALAALELARAARKAQGPRPSLRKAIKAKCIDCIHDPLERGSWLDHVDACNSEDCPLWAVRPRRKVQRTVRDGVTCAAGASNDKDSE